jgi:glycosyltransferase involved in cell wall biosynthesis
MPVRGITLPKRTRDLALVMPVYNEEECIVEVVKSWHDELNRLKIDFNMIVLNDGSRDNTASRLAEFNGNDRIHVIHKQNSGHGPTILLGYHMAVDEAEWVFQVDSDDELKARDFDKLWSQRKAYDALFGYRVGRRQSASRKSISVVSRAVVRLLFGKGIVDVNIPYRLIKSAILKEIVDQIPGDTFAPNVIISGALASSGLPIFNCPVTHEHRKTGTISIVNWKLWKAAYQSFWQTINCRPRLGGKQT